MTIEIDLSKEHIKRIELVDRSGLDLPDEVRVTTDHAAVVLPDRFALWEQLTAELLTQGERPYVLSWLHAEDAEVRT